MLVTGVACGRRVRSVGQEHGQDALLHALMRREGRDGNPKLGCAGGHDVALDLPPFIICRQSQPSARLATLGRAAAGLADCSR